jgi:mannose-6-phosphate isomerase-like protein (cupin superfamily)
MKRLVFLLALFTSVGALEAHETFEWNHTAYRVVLASEDTGKAISIFWSQTTAPGGPPMHVHDDADETFYVLQGRTRFVVDGEEVVVYKGEAAHVPRGAEHTYRVLDENGGAQLTILSPGGFEHFFAAVAAEGLTIPEDMPRINEIAAEFNLRFTGPPLPADGVTVPEEAEAARR